MLPLIFSLPHYPSLFLPIPSSRTPMAAIIAYYSVYVHYHDERVGMYVNHKTVSQFLLFGQPFVGPLTAALLSEVGSDGYHAR